MALTSVVTSAKLTSRELIKRLPIVEENILVEASKQPQYFIDAAQYRVAKFRQRGFAELGLETGEAMLSLKLRQAPLEGDEKRPTEGTIKAMIDADPHIQLLKRTQIEAQARDEFSKLLIRAYEKRSDAIEIIAGARRYESMHDESLVNKIQRRKISDRARELEMRRRKLNED